MTIERPPFVRPARAPAPARATPAPLVALLCALLVALPASPTLAQERGGAALGPLVRGLGVSARVLVIAAHPDDEDTQLITWLAKGRRVETAYLSLTRGDGGQNLIGNELGEGLGAIRTEELLAARRVDGGRQYFTRAYDFGFSKNAEETLTHWARDSILRDVVTAVRAFRPHVIVAVFSGTPADGHGHHQVSGILAREAYELAGDAGRFPPAATAGHAPWTVSKFYRGASFRNQDKATIRMNVGEYDPLLGRSYAEIASDSRSQHKSQAFGSLQLRGVRFDQLMREATRVNASQEARSERSIFDGIDTTWGRFAPKLASPEARAALDSLPLALGAAANALDLFRPEGVIPALARVHALAARLCEVAPCRGADDGDARGGDPDLARSLEVLESRLHEALALASGVALEATASRELWATGERVPVRLALYNRGERPLSVLELGVSITGAASRRAPGSAGVELPPDSVRRDSTVISLPERSEPWWLSSPRRGAMFTVPVTGVEESGRGVAAWGEATLLVGGVRVPVRTPVTYRFADPIRGEVNTPVAAAPAVTLLLDHEVMYAPANVPIEREVRVHVRSHDGGAREVEVKLALPAGLVADSVVRRLSFTALPGEGEGRGALTVGGADEVRTLTFNVRGRLAPGRHEISAVATSGGERFTSGFVAVRYDHIRTQRLFRPSTLGVEAVDVRVPRGATIAYIAGVGDNVAPMLEQLGIGVTMIDPATLPRADLSRFTAVVVGTRAYEASALLVANNARLLDYARGGGTLVVQYGQYEMTRPGILPYPIALGRPAARVTVENAPVRILEPVAPVLSAPNRISAADFAGWVQDRSLYMPATFDSAYKPAVEIADPGEKGNQGGILVASYGKGTFVYTTLAFFRQLPNGVPGAARLFVNLISARAPTVQP